MSAALKTWGKLPNDAFNELQQRYWHTLSKFKQLLRTDLQQHPIIIHLKPPTSGKVITQNTAHFQHFVKAWQSFDNSNGLSAIQVLWERKNLGFLGEQSIPSKLIIQDLYVLSQLLGKSAIQRLDNLQAKFSQLIQLGSTAQMQQLIFTRLIESLDMIEMLSEQQTNKLVMLLPQLQQNMGQGNYLRAVNVAGIDTKFIENNLKIIEMLVPCLHLTCNKTDSETLTDASDYQPSFDLISWLGCESKPNGWLFVRPLCESSRQALANLPLLKLSAQTLLDYELPTTNILIIENETPCFMLSNLPDTIAVAGGGKNVTWLQADWLKHKNVGYWGDLDSEGFAMLSDARRKCSHIQSLMMTKQIFERYAERRVGEPVFKQSIPQFLTQEELQVFELIQQQNMNQRRLEQEFIDQDVVVQTLKNWLK